MFLFRIPSVFALVWSKVFDEFCLFNSDVDVSQPEVRRKWKMGSRVEIYSNSAKKWFAGKIAKIEKYHHGYEDEEGEEWLEIIFKTEGSKGVYSEEIQRWSMV